MSEQYTGKRRMWRTPNAGMVYPKSTVTKLDGRTASDPQVGLADQVLAVERRMWPTPRAGATSDQVSKPGSFFSLDAAVHRPQLLTPVTPVSSQLTLFAEAFPASPTPWLADVAALRTNATSGRPSPESFASVNPDGSWRKTCQGYSQVMLDGSLEPFSETWPRAGMTRNGTAYRLPPSAPLTDATASGSWPTPQNRDGKHNGSRQQWAADGKGGLDLVSAVQMWPTPCAQEDNKSPAAHLAMKARMKGGPRYTVTSLQVAAKLWPTPSARDWKDGRCSDTTWAKGSRPLNEAALWRTPQARDGQERGASSPDRREEQGHSISLHDQIGGQLNPTWVEWLMGYPTEWTACAAWATRSFRQSRSGSRGASSRPTE
jgi:hypothetical protein